MSITTTAPATWTAEPEQLDAPMSAMPMVGAGQPHVAIHAALAAQVARLMSSTPIVGDPHARERMADLLHRATGWDLFVPGDREYVSRLWAEDWDSAEDAVYDEPDD